MVGWAVKRMCGLLPICICAGCICESCCASARSAMRTDAPVAYINFAINLFFAQCASEINML